MVLDYPLLSADDIDDVRAQIRRLPWDGPDGSDGTDDIDGPNGKDGGAELAAKVRRLVADGVLAPTTVLRAADMYGIAGPDVLRRQLDLLLAAVMIGCGRPWGCEQGFCRNARTRTILSPNWWSAWHNGH